MLEVQPKDSRGYFMLPQAPEDAGYTSTARQIRVAANMRILTC